MEWEFTPQELVKGDVDYGLEQFRGDMYQEVCGNLQGMDTEMQERLFDLIYDLCYWQATGGEFDVFVAGLNQDSTVPAFLESIREHMQPNVEMLGAILQRLIMERVDGHGIALEDALKQVDELHQSVVGAKSLRSAHA